MPSGVSLRSPAAQDLSLGGGLRGPPPLISTSSLVSMDKTYHLVSINCAQALCLKWLHVFAHGIPPDNHKSATALILFVDGEIGAPTSEVPCGGLHG